MQSNWIKQDLLPLLNLAIPLIFTGLIQSSLGFFETIFLAQLGENALAAGGLVNWLFVTFIVIIFGIFSAVNILIAHKKGANDHAGIILVLRDGLLLAVLMALPTFILFWKIPLIFVFFGQSPHLVELATLYLHALAWGIFPKFILIILFELVLGLGHARTIMVVSILTIPIYILFSFVLIFGKFGFPALGIAGAGWGMTIADWIITLILFCLLYYSPTYKSYIRPALKWRNKSSRDVKETSYILEMLHLGIPMGIMYGIEVGSFLVIAIIMGILSIQALAANQITMQYLMPLMSIVFSIAQAVTVRMGHLLGALQMKQAKNTAYTGVFLSAIFMMVVAVCYWSMPGFLISIDINIHDTVFKQTVHLATGFLFVAAFFQILEAIRISFFGALRAVKDTRFTLLASIIGFWIIPLPMGYAFAVLWHFGGTALWWSMVAGSCVTVLLLYHRFYTLSHKW